MLKSINDKLEAINAELVNSITFCIGFAVVLWGALSGYTTAIGTILISIGTSLIASSVVVFISTKYMFKQNKIKDIIEKWGMIGIYDTRAKMNDSANISLENNENNLDIIAFGLRNFRDAQTDIIKQKVSQGMQIRILTINPKSKFLEQREKDEKELPGQIANTIVQLDSWVEEIKQMQIRDKQVQIKFYDTLPLDFYFRLDNRLFIGPYLYGKTSQQTISYEYSYSSVGFEYYVNYFENLWNDETFAKEASI